MTLDNFYNEMSLELENFKTYWIEQNKINPEDFPIEIENENSGDWMLQFLAYIKFNL